MVSFYWIWLHSVFLTKDQHKTFKHHQDLLQGTVVEFLTFCTNPPSWLIHNQGQPQLQAFSKSPLKYCKDTITKAAQYQNQCIFTCTFDGFKAVLCSTFGNYSKCTFYYLNPWLNLAYHFQIGRRPTSFIEDRVVDHRRQIILIEIILYIYSHC